MISLLGLTPIGGVQLKVSTMLQQKGIGNIANTEFATIKESYDIKLFQNKQD
jgi:hypothetical protein